MGLQVELPLAQSANLKRKIEPVLALLQFAEQRRARFRQIALRPGFGGFHLFAQQLLADAAVLVLELFAAERRAHARPDDVEVARFGDVIVGAGS